jgi:hypothetical protein
LRTSDFPIRQRCKIEQKIEYHSEWLCYTEAEQKDQYRAFSEAIAQIERALRDLAETYQTLANVHRFEHG